MVRVPLTMTAAHDCSPNSLHRLFPSRDWRAAVGALVAGRDYSIVVDILGGQRRTRGLRAGRRIAVTAMPLNRLAVPHGITPSHEGLSNRRARAARLRTSVGLQTKIGLPRSVLCPAGACWIGQSGCGLGECGEAAQRFLDGLVLHVEAVGLALGQADVHGHQGDRACLGELPDDVDVGDLAGDRDPLVVHPQFPRASGSRGTNRRSVTSRTANWSCR
jgi:hypothetical protein